MGRLESSLRLEQIRLRLIVLEDELAAMPADLSPEFSRRAEEGFHLMYEVGEILARYPELKHAEKTH